MLAAFAAALLMSGGVSAKEKADGPKPKKVCRTVQVSGRVTPQRICRSVPPAETSVESDGRKPTTRDDGNGRD
jgi:hypothetical protein